jgi:hypothetical protein
VQIKSGKAFHHENKADMIAQAVFNNNFAREGSLKG